MAAEEKISSYIDEAAVTKETKTLLALMDQLLAKFDEVGKRTVSLDNSKGSAGFKKEVKEAMEAVNEYSNASKMVVDQNGKLVETIKKQKVAFAEIKPVVAGLGKSYYDNIQVLAQLKVQSELVSKSLNELKRTTADADKQSDAYQARLGQLLQAQLENKTATNELNVALRNQEKEFQATEGSVDELQAKMNQLQQRWESLSEVDRDSPIGVGLKKGIDELQPRLTQAEQSIGKFGRNVGNYKSAFDGLGMSFTQVARELPSLAINMQTFLLAISNNLPMVFDQIGETNAQLKAMRAEGQAVPSLFSKIKDSLFSWNIVLSIGVTLLTLFGAKLFEFVAGLFDSEVALKKAKEAQKALNESMIESMELYDRIYSVRKKSIDQAVDETRNKIKLNEIAKASDEDLLKSEIDIANQRLKIAGGGNENAAATIVAETKATNALILDAMEVQARALETLNDDIAKEKNEKKKKSLELEKDLLQQSLKKNQINYDDNLAVINEYYDAVQSKREADLKLQVYQQEQARKLTLETIRISANTNIDANERVLNNEKSTLNQRLEAIKANLKEKRRIVNAELSNALNDPKNKNADGSFTAEAKIAIKNANAEKLKLDKDFVVDSFKVREDYRRRDIQAQLSVDKTEIDLRLKSDEEIFNNQQESLANRLQATAQYTQDQIALAKKEYDVKVDIMKASGATDAELEAALVDHNAKVYVLTVDGQRKLLEVTKAYYDNLKKELDEWQTEEINRIETHASELLSAQSAVYTNEVVALNKKFTEGKVGTEKYNKELTKIEDDNAKKVIAIQIDKAKAYLQILKETNADRLKESNKINTDIDTLEKQYLASTDDAERKTLKGKIDAKKEAAKEFKDINKEVADAEIALDGLIQKSSQKTAEDRTKKLEQFKALVDEINGYVQQAAQFIQSLLAANIEAQKNQVQAQIDALDKQKEADIAAANAQAGTAQEKADKIATINTVAAAKKEALERRQRELDNKKARQDRDFAVLTVILNTATAIIKAVAAAPLTGGLPFSAIAAAIGAAQIAAILATPLPKYAKGRDGGPAEFAIVGEQGAERLDFADGTSALTPNKPTLTFLPEGTSVIPHHQTMLDMLSAASLRSMVDSSGRAVSEKDFDSRLAQVMQTEMSGLRNDFTKLERTMKNMPQEHFSFDEHGFKKWVEAGQNRTDYINKMYKH